MRVSVRRSFIVVAFVFTVASLCLVKVVAASPPAPDTGAEATYRSYDLDPTIPVASRVGKTPRSVLSLFDEPGQPAPKNHLLSDAERAKLVFAIQTMPPVHRFVRIDCRRERRVRHPLLHEASHVVDACERVNAPFCWQRPHNSGGHAVCRRRLERIISPGSALPRLGEVADLVVGQGGRGDG